MSSDGVRAAMRHVVCFGNLWQGDDGFGIHVFRRLRAMRLPPRVKVFEGGTAGLSALQHLEGCGKAVIVDAIKTGGRPGTVRRFLLEEFDTPGQEYSIHALGVNHLLAALPVVFEGGVAPEVIVIGAEIGRISPFTDRLTPPVEAALGGAVDAVIKECTS
jgi:hydrogenase maturation protease